MNLHLNEKGSPHICDFSENVCMCVWDLSRILWTACSFELKKQFSKTVNSKFVDTKWQWNSENTNNDQY